MKTLLTQLDKETLPNHIAIITDGNGRWAQSRNANRLYGHKKGVDSLKDIVEFSSEIGLKHLTIYGFSTENWRRPEEEVTGLLKLIMESLMKEIRGLIKNNVSIKFIGTTEGLPTAYREKLDEISKTSWNNTGLQFTIAMNYGGRKEIVDAVNNIIEFMREGAINGNFISEDMITKNLYTAAIPDPDLIIRTSGEQRLSNFLLWQSAYSELWFTKTLWPDFRRKEFLTAILEYQHRNRRFGGI